MTRAVLMLSFFALCLALTRRAAACSCFPAETIQHEIDKTDSVLEAEVVELRPLGSDGWEQTVVLDVMKSYKGVAGSRVELVTAVETASCGYPFAPGKQYLVYAHRNGPRLEVSLCSRTRPLAEAADDLRVLAARNPGPVPAPEATKGRDEPGNAKAVEVSSRPVETGDERGPEPRRGGCAGCALTSSTRDHAPLAVFTVLLFGATLRRREPA